MILTDTYLCKVREIVEISAVSNEMGVAYTCYLEILILFYVDLVRKIDFEMNSA